MNNVMGATDEYIIFSVALSVLAVGLSTVHLWRVSIGYRRFHDDLAAVSLAKSIGMFVISLGLLISAIGLAGGGADLPIIGLSMARGALVLTLAALVLANVSLEHSHNPCRDCPSASCAGCTRAIKDDMDHQ
jgi:hypothetical protein